MAIGVLVLLVMFVTALSERSRTVSIAAGCGRRKAQHDSIILSAAFLKGVWKFICVLSAPFLLHFLWGYSHSEMYCFFYPSIDTQYAPGYSERAFSQLTPGMTAQAVQQKLGAPLYVQSLRDGRQLWFYTLDGKCRWGDWAWLARGITVQNGVVTEVVKRVCYD